MGIKYEQAAAAIQQYQSVDLALEHLLINRGWSFILKIELDV